MRMNYLFDFYESLLTTKQNKYMEMYYIEDYSLGEIAQMFEVSRQAVYDNIKRTEQILEDYETKLHLYEKFEKRTKILAELEKTIAKMNIDERMSIFVNQLKDLD